MYYYIYIIYPSKKIIYDGPYDSKLTAGTEALKSKRRNKNSKNMIDDLSIIVGETNLNKKIEQLRIKGLKKDYKELKTDNKIIRKSSSRVLKLGEKVNLYKEQYDKNKAFRKNNYFSVDEDVMDNNEKRELQEFFIRNHQYNYSDPNTNTYVLVTKSGKCLTYSAPKEERVSDTMNIIINKYPDLYKVRKVSNDQNSINNMKQSLLRSMNIENEKSKYKYDSSGMPGSYKNRIKSDMKSNIKNIKITNYSIIDTIGKTKNSIERAVIGHNISNNIKKASKKLENKINPKVTEKVPNENLDNSFHSMTEVNLIG